MFVKFDLKTQFTGCDDTIVCKVHDNSTEDYIEEVGDSLARDNADMHGVFDDADKYCEEIGLEFNESDCYSFSYEILDYMSEQEIIDTYGCIEELV